MIVDDSGLPIQINLHYNTINDPASSTTIENVHQLMDTSGTYNITRLVEKTNYYIWVSAIDAAGNFRSLVNVDGAQPATTLGTPPAGLSGVAFASATANIITLGGLGGITDASYPVQFTVKCRLTSVETDAVAAQAHATITAAGSTPSITIPRLSSDTRYYLWLEATDNLGTVASATLHTVDIKTLNGPTTGTLTAVKDGSNAIVVGGLNTLADPDGLSNSEISIEYKRTNDTIYTAVAADRLSPTKTIPGLAAATTYNIRVKVTDNKLAVTTFTLANVTTDPAGDVWDFIVTQAPSTTYNIELDRVQWDGTQALATSMFTYLRPGATTSNLGSPTVDLLLDTTIDTPLKWTPTAAPVGSTLFTITTPIVATDPVWTLTWWKPRNRPGLEIKKNGVRFWIDPTLNSTGETPNPNPVHYPPPTQSVPYEPTVPGKDRYVFEVVSKCGGQPTDALSAYFNNVMTTGITTSGLQFVYSNQSDASTAQLVGINSWVPLNALWVYDTVAGAPFTSVSITHNRPKYRGGFRVTRNGVEIYKDQFLSTADTPTGYTFAYTWPAP